MAIQESSRNSRNYSACLKLSRAYWKHIQRTSGDNQSTRILPYIGLIAGMISGTTSLVSGVMGLKSANNSVKSINVSINNFSKYSLVVYKLVNVSETEINDIVIPRDQKGTLIINNCSFNENDGPELHMILDDGKVNSLCIAKLGWTSSKGQMRIRNLTFNDNKKDIIFDDEACSKIKGVLDYPIYSCGTSGNEEASFIITNPPIMDNECCININIFDGDV